MSSTVPKQLSSTPRFPCPPSMVNSRHLSRRLHRHTHRRCSRQTTTISHHKRKKTRQTERRHRRSEDLPLRYKGPKRKPTLLSPFCPRALALLPPCSGTSAPVFWHCLSRLERIVGKSIPTPTQKGQTETSRIPKGNRFQMQTVHPATPLIHFTTPHNFERLKNTCCMYV